MNSQEKSPSMSCISCGVWLWHMKNLKGGLKGRPPGIGLTGRTSGWPCGRRRRRRRCAGSAAVPGRACIWPGLALPAVPGAARGVAGPCRCGAVVCCLAWLMFVVGWVVVWLFPGEFCFVLNIFLLNLLNKKKTGRTKIGINEHQHSNII